MQEMEIGEQSGGNRLDGKAIVITGASRGLGRAYAIACSEAGAGVVVNGSSFDSTMRTVHDIRHAGGRAVAAVGSVASWDESQQAVDLCIAEFGRIDGYVANAAVMHLAEPWDEDERLLRDTAEVNILGVQFGVRHAMKAMVQNHSAGSIITITSAAILGEKKMSAYGASKGAVTAMTLGWAIDGARHGIRVNAVSPRARTSMTRDHIAETGQDDSGLHNPARIAPLIVALLADATANITGNLVWFDGRTVRSYETTRIRLAERTDWTAESLAQVLQASLIPGGDSGR